MLRCTGASNVNGDVQALASGCKRWKSVTLLYWCSFQDLQRFLDIFKVLLWHIHLQC